MQPDISGEEATDYGEMARLEKGEKRRRKRKRKRRKLWEK